MVVLCAGLVLFSKRASFDDFIAGTKDGMNTAVRLLPTLLGLVVAIKMLRASGATEFFASLLAPAFDFVGVPSELLTLILTRPFSGSAASAIFCDLMEEFGADSFIGLSASVIMGSSDSAVYIIELYFSSVGIKKSRHAFVTAFLVMLFCIFFSCFLCRAYIS